MTAHPATAPSARPFRPLPAILLSVGGAGCLLLLVVVNVTGAQPPLDIHGQVALFGLGVALSLGGLLRLPGRPRSRAAAPLTPVTRAEIASLLAILVVALLLRTVDLHTAIRLFVDEVVMAMAVTDIANRPDDLRLLAPVALHWHHPWLFPYANTLTTDLLGRTLAGHRLPAALVGLVAVVGVWLLGRVGWNRWVGLGAALLLATLPAQIHLNRLALPNNADAAFGVLGIALLLGALRHEVRPAWVLGGAALGLTHYFYEGGRLLLTGVTVVTLLTALLLTRRLTLHWRGAWRGGVAFALLTIPVYATFILRGEPLTQRLGLARTSDVFLAQFLLSGGDDLPQFIEHFTRGLRLFFGARDPSVYYRAPLVFAPLLPFIGVGLLALVAHARRRRFVALPASVVLLWLALNIAADALLGAPGQITRFMPSLPLVGVIGAVGVVTLAGWLRRRWLAAPLFVLLALAGAITFWSFVVPNFNAERRDEMPTHDLEDVMWRVARLPPGTPVYILSTAPFDQEYLCEILRFMVDDPAACADVHGWFVGIPPLGYFEMMPRPVAPRMAPYVPSRAALRDLPFDRPTAVFIEADDQLSRLHLATAYGPLPPPQGSDYPVAPEHLMHLYWLPPRAD